MDMSENLISARLFSTFLAELMQSDLPTKGSRNGLWFCHSVPPRLPGEASKGVNSGATLSSPSDSDRAEVSTAEQRKCICR